MRLKYPGERLVGVLLGIDPMPETTS